MSKELLAEEVINDALRGLCERRFGVVDHEFMTQSVGVLNPPKPLCVDATTPVIKVVSELRRLKVGCVLVVDKGGRLVGMFSERDYVLKVDLEKKETLQAPVSAYMTRDPLTGSFDMPIAYALNLMSQGGFRHIPLVDDEGVPYGVISVKDIVDNIVAAFTQDLLSFEPASHI